MWSIRYIETEVGVPLITGLLNTGILEFIFTLRRMQLKSNHFWI